MTRPATAALSVDLCSDTVTKPSDGMRSAMRDAVVGDEQRREDPTVLGLEERVAELLGKDEAVFLPSGTMCNIVALFVHCRPGDEVVMADTSHPVYAENAGPAVHSRASLFLIPASDGVFSGRELEESIRPDGPQRQRTRVVAVENTNTLGGGTVWPVETLDDVVRTAEKRGLLSHLDGARLLNAAVASGVPADRLTAGFDSAWIDLSKGLGCPMGAVLAGSREFAAEARRAKHLFGGALRQAGFAAAAGIYALDNNIERLADDHANARYLASGLRQIDGLALADDAPHTNIVRIAIEAGRPSAEELVTRCLGIGVRFGIIDRQTLRAVTHLHIDRAAVERAVEALAAAMHS